MDYRVYLWLLNSSVAAEIVADLVAASPGQALTQVMEQYSLSYVSFAWVVSPDDETVDARSEQVVLVGLDDLVCPPMPAAPVLLYEK